MALNHFKIHKGTTHVPQASAPSNPSNGDVYYDSTLNRFRAYEAGAWTDLISSASDGINYISNPGAESGVDGYSAYKDVAGVAPVDGTGGSPTLVSLTRTTNSSEILIGDGSFKLTKASGNAQGEGESYNFSIDPKYKTSKLQVSFDYKNLDANYVSNDMIIYVYDVTNTTLLGAIINGENGAVLKSQSNGVTFIGEFETTSSLNYRLIFHVATTNSSAWSMSIDSIKVSPISKDLFFNATDPIPFSPILSWITNTTSFGSLKRVGTDLLMEISIQLTGAPNAVPLTITMPNNLTINTSNPVLGSSTKPLGYGGLIDNGVYVGDCTPHIQTSTLIEVRGATIGTASTRGLITQSFPFVWANTDRIELTIRVPIDAWTSTNVVSNNELNISTVAAYTGAQIPTGTIAANFNNVVIFSSTIRDTAGIYNPANGRITIPKSGFYDMSANLEMNATFAGNGEVGVRLFNVTSSGVIATGQRVVAAGSSRNIPSTSAIFYANKNDIIEVRSYLAGGTTPTYTSNFTGSFFSIKSIPDFTNYGVINPNSDFLSTSSGALLNWPAASGVYGDLTSLSIPAGEWDVTLQVIYRNDSGTPLIITDILVGLSTTAGNSFPELSYGTSADTGVTTATAFESRALGLSNLRINPSSTTTYYLKVNAGNVVASLKTRGYKLTARRIK